MSEAYDLGKEGERMALEWLIEHQYCIVETNFRYQKAEIDIIAEKENIMVFVEVKTRQINAIQNPEEAVNFKKRQLILLAANQFLEENHIQKEARFDIISIFIYPHKKSIRHIEDAYNSVN